MPTEVIVTILVVVAIFAAFTIAAQKADKVVGEKARILRESKPTPAQKARKK